MRPEIGENTQALDVGQGDDAGDHVLVDGVARTADQQLGGAVTGGSELGRIDVVDHGLERLGTRHRRPAELAHGITVRPAWVSPVSPVGKRAGEVHGGQLDLPWSRSARR